MRRLLAGFVGSIGLVSLLVGCGTFDTPTAPSRNATTTSLSGFGVIAAAQGQPSLASCLTASGTASCFGAESVSAPNTAAESTLAPAAPLNLVASSSGSSVTLTWTAPATTDSLSTYLIEAGSASGLANLASFATGNTLTIFQASGIGAGTYYVRVRAVSASGASVPSNEAVLVVGGSGPCVAPGAPSGLVVVFNTGGVVTLAWTAAAGAPTSYLVEAGSSPGLSDLANSDVGSATSFTATGVGAGTYYVRMKAKGPCGTSGPSNEIALVVGVTPSNGGGSPGGGTTPGGSTPTPVAAPGLPSRTAVGAKFACSLDAIVHPASCVNNSFGNATALCNDGARSCSTSNSGTCSSHSGVYCYVCPGGLCP
jgi:fibronectin type III domain protein